MTRLVGRGPSLPKAFADLAAAVFGLIADLERVEEREVREVRAHGSTPERLLERFVDEILYVHEVEGFAPRRIEFAVWSGDAGGAEPLRLHAVLHGEASHDGTSVEPRSAVTRDTSRPAEVAETPGGYEVAVSFG